MKTSKRSNPVHGGQEPSILSFLSAPKRKNPKLEGPKSIGTPATPVAVEGRHHLVDAIKVVGTPASVVSNDTAESKPTQSNHHRLNWSGPTDMNDRRTLGELQLKEPNTPPSPAKCHEPDSREEYRIDSIEPIKTPPSNDAEMTTPQSPPTPDNATWMCSVVDQTVTHPIRNTDTISKNPEDLYSVRESLNTRNGQSEMDSIENQISLNLGTPVSSGTPSTASSDSRQSQIFFRKYAPSSMSIKFSRNVLPSKATKSTKKQKQANQLFLDYGQKSFGKQTICDTCGMLRVHGLDEDDAQHAKICEDYKQGVSCLGWKNERMVMAVGRDDRILEVRLDDAQQHVAKVLEVKEIVDKELGFANMLNGESTSSRHLKNLTSYMYISNKRVVGLLLVKRIQRGYEFLPCIQRERNIITKSSSISRSLKPSKALVGIHQIWVHKDHRHRGIATNLVTAARDHLIFGMVVPLELIAFSSPTEEGLRFAQSYVGSERPLIYDIR